MNNPPTQEQIEDQNNTVGTQMQLKCFICRRYLNKQDQATMRKTLFGAKNARCHCVTSLELEKMAVESALVLMSIVALLIPCLAAMTITLKGKSYQKTNRYDFGRDSVAVPEDVDSICFVLFVCMEMS